MIEKGGEGFKASRRVRRKGLTECSELVQGYRLCDAGRDSARVEAV